MNPQGDRFARERSEMVSLQIQHRGVKDPRVLDAMGKVPRHEFVPDNAASWAYADSPLSIGNGQTISQPYIVALMSELLRLEGDEKVLEIGTGSGYQTAILCELAGFVYSLERIPRLVDLASKQLGSLGYENYMVQSGDGTLGWQEEAPFDAILVTAAAPQVPQNLLDQLALHGSLVIPVGDRFSQVLQVWLRHAHGLDVQENIRVVFVPLIGKQGWDESH
ncbi:MAG: protein-L-isoaspartate(D-aspartate) O-methyltransferase [Anaerolineaceae bacterium]|nr:protein-L-isoaspartate(D-aspartate) O-methyltransferase [Anaerolineaceae bacterium]